MTSTPSPGVLHARAVAALAAGGIAAFERCADFVEQRVPYAPSGVRAADRQGELLRRLLDERLWEPDKAASTKLLLERYVRAAYADVNVCCSGAPDTNAPIARTSAVLVAALWNRVDAMATLIELGADCEKTTYGGEAASLWGVLEGETSDTKILGNAHGLRIGAAARAALMRREIAATLGAAAPVAAGERLASAAAPSRRHRGM